MIQNKKIITIIPARYGSKGLAQKNIRLFKNKPLIAYTIKSALQSKYTDVVALSTESQKIADIAKTYGLHVPFLRPQKYARDTSPSSEAILHTLRWYKRRKQEFDIIVLLEPTSPLRKIDDIDRAIELFVEQYNKADSLVSVGEIHTEHPYIAQIVKKGHVKPLLHIKRYHQRQQLPTTYFPYGVIYASKTTTYIKNRSFYQKRTIPYFIERWQNYEIDDIYDFMCAEKIYDQMIHI